MFTPDALLFDMDGLLLDSERVALHSFLETTGTFDIDADRAKQFFLTLVGTSTAITRQRVDEFLPRHHDRDEFAQMWSAAFKTRMTNQVPLKPFVGDVLARLAAKGVRMSVVTYPWR